MTGTNHYKSVCLLGFCAVATAMGPGCTLGDRDGGRAVSDAWQEPPATPSDEQDLWEDTAAEGQAKGQDPRHMPIAIVNGRPIPRQQMLELLIRTHGMTVLGQLIALELVRQTAESEGISITPADIQDEYNRALMQISSPVPASTQPSLGKEAREAMLAQILLRRGLTREEFNLAMERRAYLRKIAEKRLKIDQDMLRAQYEMMYDERVQIRHIQLSSWRDVSKVQRLLQGGMDFAEVAKVHSTNAATAQRGGELPPFSRSQDDVPPLLREAAFKLKEGQVSNPIRLGTDYHIIKVIKRFPKSKVQFEHVKELVRVRLRERLLPEVMDRIENGMVEQARTQIQITHPELRRQFKERYAFRQNRLTGENE